METISLLRVFLASPGDVKAERDLVEKIISETNRTIGEAHGVRIEVTRWETQGRLSPSETRNGAAPLTAVTCAFFHFSKIIEDPNFRESHRSHFVQAADLCAFLLYQQLAPSAFMKKKGGQKFFDILETV